MDYRGPARALAKDIRGRVKLTDGDMLHIADVLERLCAQCEYFMEDVRSKEILLAAAKERLSDQRGRKR
jgi:hypothetical protein